MSRTLRFLLALGVLLLAAGAAQAATIPVTTTADGVATNGACTLREAVFSARFNGSIADCVAGSAAEVDTIVLGPGRFEIEPTPGGADEDGTESGDLDTGPGNDLRIAGAGAGASVIDALLGGRAFEVNPGSRLALEGLTIRRGRSGPGAPGGAIQNQGVLSVLRAAFEDNATGAGQDGVTSFEEQQPGGAGGAIWSGNSASASVLVAESTFTGNATGRGGAGLSTPTRSSGGDVGGAGGAIAFASGAGDISGSTFARNRTGDGGPGGSAGIPHRGGIGGPGGALSVSGGANVTVVNSTFAGNAAGAPGAPVSGGFGDVAVGGAGGAAHLADGTLRISWSTFAGNARGAGAADASANGVQGGQVSASVLADALPACGGLLPSTLRNVVRPGDTSCAPPRLEGDARLGPLGANGGPTPTLLPGSGSAAVDALVGVPCPGTDQRGLGRPRFGGCDAGAVEVQPGEPVGAAPRSTGSRTSARAARSLSALSMSPSSFRAALSGGSIGVASSKALQQRAPIGTTVRYRLDGAARVTFTVRAPAPGRKKGKRCVRPAAAPRGAKACTRQKLLTGSFAHQGGAGQSSLRFTGRLRRKALAPGPYTLVAKLPRPAAGRGALATKAFRIVR